MLTFVEAAIWHPAESATRSGHQAIFRIELEGKNMATLERAVAIAAAAHVGQVDKAELFEFIL
ncbi:hypothetical protein GCM10007863_17290 [Dyella mobilis]|nr:hypothetical protein GCM10007863_17290 [Dyella mobilis]